ncbi:hypothetical protein [Ensifer adhaerens]|uniref:hypothetical protein n=1 Tax=Ensifer adhaerens TaxID=106592 RepID=UPI000CF1637B|nr:hypothetical protein [Ensifer adhaerens]
MSDLVKRLLDADWNSQQRFLGSRICGEAADRISQQDAELDRMRRELDELKERRVGNLEAAGTLHDELMAVRRQLAEARAGAFREASLTAYAINSRGETAVSLQLLIVQALRAKAEETRT